MLESLREEERSTDYNHHIKTSGMHKFKTSLRLTFCDNKFFIIRRTENKDYLPHGLKVVMAVVESEGILALERMWRQHFLDTMRPKYLPDLWSVNHRHDILIQNSKDTHSLELLVGKKSKQYN